MCKRFESLKASASANEKYNALLADAADCLRAAFAVLEEGEKAGGDKVSRNDLSKDLTARVCEMIEALPRLIGNAPPRNPMALDPDDGKGGKH